MKKKKRGDGNLGLQRSVSGIMTFSRRKIKGEEHFYLAAINIQNNRAGRKV